MADERTHSPDTDDDTTNARDVLEAFNAEEIVDRPGEPPEPDGSPASDADAPAPG